MRTVEEGSWEFMGAPWSVSAEGELAPPEGTDVEYLAVKADAAYADLTATFRYKLRTITGIRCVFRVQDSRHYYALDIPANGQQFRSRTFWAGIVVADGTALQRYLTFALVPGLCAQVGHWYSVRVEAKGPRLRAWIEGILVADVEDHTHGSGRVGLATIQNPYPESPRFADFRIEGTPRPLARKLPLVRPEPHWITPVSRDGSRDLPGLRQPDQEPIR